MTLLTCFGLLREKSVMASNHADEIRLGCSERMGPREIVIRLFGRYHLPAIPVLDSTGSYAGHRDRS
jgi:hypothetical protein